MTTIYDSWLAGTRGAVCRLCGKRYTISYGQGECPCCGDAECEHAQRKAAEDADHD